MPHIEKRKSGKWRARYRVGDGRELSKSFDRKIDAERFLVEQQSRLNTGSWVDPAEGKRTFGDVARRWQEAQVHRASTQMAVTSILKNHILPTFEARPIAAVRPTEIQAWVKGRNEVLEAATVETAYRHLSSIFRSAVEDRLIAASPCNSRVRLPRKSTNPVIPLSVEEVIALADAFEDRYRALALFAAGTGVRQGEAFGVTLDRVDFLRRRVTIDRQLVLTGRDPVFGPPKTTASVRTIPLADATLNVLAKHIERYPVGCNGFVFTDANGGALRRNRFGEVMRRARAEAKLPDGVTFHDLRHFYASLLIRHGESVKVVQARLGHASAAETLDTYSHLWPDSEDRTREAVSAMLGDVARPICGLAAHSG